MWNTASFATPNTIINAAQTASDVNSLSGYAAKTSSLNGVAHAQTSKNSAAASSTDTEQFRESIESINVFSKFVCVHPWQHGIGQGRGIYKALSAPNAVNVMASKLTDTNDYQRPTDIKEALAILVSSSSYSALYEKIAIFNAAFHLPEAKMIERLCKTLSEWENNKLQLPAPAINARWHDRNVLSSNSTSNLFNHAARVIAITESLNEENKTPKDELIALIQKKQDYLNSVKTAFDSFSSNINGQAGHAAFFPSMPIGDIAGSLRTSNPPGHENSIAVGFLFVAEPNTLTSLKSMVGL